MGNNFDFLRLAAATLVLVSHSFVVVGQAEPHVGHWPLGTLGVEIFFAISGYLIVKSWLGKPGLRAFAAKRSLRILPALAVVVLLSSFVLGPIVTSEPRSDYFGSLEPSAYALDNVAAVATGDVVRDPAYDLPGVFSSHPDPAVNRSLWTLPIEVQAYAMVALLGLLGVLFLRRGLPLVAAGGLLMALLPEDVGSWALVGTPMEFIRGADAEAAHLLALFAIAGLMYVHRERIPLHGGLAAVALAGWLASFGSPLERPLSAFAIPYIVLFLAFRSPARLRTLTSHADVSYGMYLLAFPVQQVVFQAWGGPGPGPAAMALVAFPVTYLLALCSWHLVEKRVLRLKDRLAEPRVGVPEPAAY